MISGTVSSVILGRQGPFLALYAEQTSAELKCAIAEYTPLPVWRAVLHVVQILDVRTLFFLFRTRRFPSFLITKHFRRSNCPFYCPTELNLHFTSPFFDYSLFFFPLFTSDPVAPHVIVNYSIETLRLCTTTLSIELSSKDICPSHLFQF